MKPIGFFVTATDTDVGKTFVSGLLLSILSAIVPAVYFKPVQSGCDGGHAPDLEYVRQFFDASSFDVNDMVPYRLAPACSPHLAARLSGMEISLDVISQSFEHLSFGSAFVVAEGAGGVLTPISDELTMIDVMQALALPVILVTSPRLGTLNHTHLSLGCLRLLGLSVAAVVFNDHADAVKDEIYRDNLAMIRALAAPAPVFELPFGASASPEIESFCHDIFRT